MFKERFFNYEDFKKALNPSYPVHYACYQKCVDPKYGAFYRYMFTLTAVSAHIPDGIVEFYAEATFSVAEAEEAKKWVEEYIERYAKPLNATPGEWRKP
jgi:hypothetical protein